MKPFWRKEPLTGTEEKLLAAVLEAHALSARRPNISRGSLLNCAAGSGDYCKSLASAILTLGGAHAPIVDTIQFIGSKRPAGLVPGILDSGKRVPGWGNSFEKGHHDPAWDTVRELIQQCDLNLSIEIEAVTEALHKAGKDIYPNPSTFTAATALILRIPTPLAPWIFIRGRLDAWTQMLQEGA